MNKPLVENLERPAIRALAEEQSAELRRIAESGGNVYQAALDQSDRQEAFASTLSEEDQIRFYTILAEEKNACAQKTEAETEATVAKNQAADAQAQYLAGLILTAVIFAILYYFVFG